MGTNTSAVLPRVVPENPAGVTPTTVIDWPFTTRVLFSTRGVRTELVLPVPVAEHGHVVFADVPVVVLRKEPPQRRLQAQDVEIGAGDHRAQGARRLALRRQIGPERKMGRYAAQRRLGLFQITEHGVAEDGIAVARLTTGLRSGLRPRGG